MLNEKQIAHRESIVSLAAELIHAKYTAGAIEHDTNLKEDTTVDQLLDFAIEEAIDQVVYLLTMKQKREEDETSGTGE